jgi:hypothetical protein
MRVGIEMMDWLLIMTICQCGLFIGVILTMISFVGIHIFDGEVVVILLILAMATFGGGWLIYDYADAQRPFEVINGTSWNTSTIQNITDLSDGQSWSLHGSSRFTLGTGTVIVNGESRPTYYFYKIMPQGYQIGSLDATNVFICEDENLRPYIEWVYSHSTNQLKRWTDNGDIDYTLNGKQTDTLVATYIHVPNGTVYKQFSVDGRMD